MLVSVIILTYNQREYIGRAIEHALAQICSFEWELIIADDHSTDGTLDICRGYARRYPERVRLIERGKNVGVLANYYDALHRARGKYVADQGGDDFWTDPYKLQKEADFLLSHPGCVLVHTDWEYFDEVTQTTSPSPSLDGTDARRELSEPGELFLPLLQHKWLLPIHMCTAMYSRQVALECYREVPGVFADPSICFEDYQLLISLASKGRVGWIGDVTLCYSVGKPSLSSNEDYSKLFRLFLSTLQVTRRLQLYHEVPDEVMIPTYRELLAVVYSNAFLSRNKRNIAEIERILKVLPFTLPPKQKLMKAFVRLRPLWHIGAKIVPALHRPR